MYEADTFLDIPYGFHRTRNIPLDLSIQFKSYKDLIDYCKSGTSYLGQRVIVSYNGYDQIVTLKKGRGDKIIPLPEFASGSEPIFKTVTGDKYVLVYYYNGGTSFDAVSQNTRTIDSLAWCMLPQASLFANSDTEIHYILEANNNSYLFTQANFTTNTTTATNNGSNITSIASSRSFDYIYPTANSTIGIMPMTKKNTIVKLWVQCNDYYNALGADI